MGATSNGPRWFLARLCGTSIEHSGREQLQQPGKKTLGGWLLLSGRVLEVCGQSTRSRETECKGDSWPFNRKGRVEFSPLWKLRARRGPHWSGVLFVSEP